MSVGTSRDRVGVHFSEGARQLWVKLPRLAKTWGVPPKSVRQELARRIDTSPGTVHRYLFGERRPDRVFAGRLLVVAGIDSNLWDKAPKAELVVPAALMSRNLGTASEVVK